MYFIIDRPVSLSLVLSPDRIGVIMSPRPDVSVERKNQILDAAASVFARSGFSKARMDDIATESELSKGTLYWYFSSKDEIILAMMNRLFEREFADLEALQHADGTAIERMEAFTDFLIQDISQLLALIPIVYEYLSLSFRDNTIRQTLRDYLRAYLEHLIPIIQQGIDQGEFRQVDASEVSIAIGAIVEGTILLWVYDSETIQVEKHIRSSLNLLFDGLLA
jgi:AcrR family transcriptional regulator